MTFFEKMINENLIEIKLTNPKNPLDGEIILKAEM